MGSIKYNYEGDVVVIVGAATGIGRGTALAFAEAGADLAICDFNEEKASETVKLCVEKGAKAKFYKLDVTNSDQINAVRDEIMKDFGKITCLFSNAGITQDVMGPPIGDIPDATWQKLFDVNLFGTVRVCRAFAEPMKAAKYGKIVMTASVAAFQQSPIMPVYNCSKISVLSFMTTLCKELGDYNINVNAINPGYVLTPIYADGGAMKVREKSKLLQQFETPEQIVKAIASGSALHRPQTVEDMANGVLFLCAENSKEISGVYLNIDSGAICRI